MTASGLPRGTSMALGLYVFGAMLLGTSAAKICRPQWIHAVIYVALFLMLYPPMLDVDLVTIRRIIFEPWPVAAALFLNFLVSPLLIFGLAQLFVETDEWRILVGIVLYGMVPGGGMAPCVHGNAEGQRQPLGDNCCYGQPLQPWDCSIMGKMPDRTPDDSPGAADLSAFMFHRSDPVGFGSVDPPGHCCHKRGNHFSFGQATPQGTFGPRACLLVFTMSLLYGDRVLTEPVLILKIACPVFAFLSILFVISSLLGKLFHSVMRRPSPSRSARPPKTTPYRWHSLSQLSVRMWVSSMRLPVRSSSYQYCWGSSPSRRSRRRIYPSNSSNLRWISAERGACGYLQ